MATGYSQTSPYYTTNMVQDYLDVQTYRKISSLASDVYYELGSKYANRPDLLAYDIYGDSKLWWVFAERNKDIIKDPVYDFVPGVKIYIPKLSTLKNDLGI